MDENIRPEVIYRWFKKNPNLIKKTCKIQDRRAFEAEMSNDLWQSDVMHGPKAIFKGINKKIYLHAIIDDHSRLILFAKFYTDERLSTFKMVLRSAIEQRGKVKDTINWQKKYQIVFRNSLYIWVFIIFLSLNIIFFEFK